MSEYSKEHVIDLLPSYAIGCLDENELPQVELHLVSCEICQAELRAFKSIINDLPLAAPEVLPPKYLKKQILGQTITEDRREERHRRSIWDSISGIFRQAPAWSLISLGLVIVLSLSNLQMWQRLNRLENISPPGLIAVNLTHTDASPESSGVIVMSGNGEYGTLVVEGLADLGSSNQYQLWLISDGVRTSGGVFSVSNEGYASLEIISPAPLKSFNAYGITIEPFGGSTGPTGEKVLGGNL